MRFGRGERQKFLLGNVPKAGTALISVKMALKTGLIGPQCFQIPVLGIRIDFFSVDADCRSSSVSGSGDLMTKKS